MHISVEETESIQVVCGSVVESSRERLETVDKRAREERGVCKDKQGRSRAEFAT